MVRLKLPLSGGLFHLLQLLFNRHTLSDRAQNRAETALKNNYNRSRIVSTAFNYATCKEDIF